MGKNHAGMISRASGSVSCQQRHVNHIEWHKNEHFCLATHPPMECDDGNESGLMEVVKICRTYYFIPR